MCACGYAGKGGIQIDVEQKLNRRNFLLDTIKIQHKIYLHATCTCYNNYMYMYHIYGMLGF